MKNKIILGLMLFSLVLISFPSGEGLPCNPPTCTSFSECNVGYVCTEGCCVLPTIEDPGHSCSKVYTESCGPIVAQDGGSANAAISGVNDYSSSTAKGIWGNSISGIGVYGIGIEGVYGGGNIGVRGSTAVEGGRGVSGQSSNANGGYGVYGTCSGTGCYGVFGTCSGTGCYGFYTQKDAYVGGLNIQHYGSDFSFRVDGPPALDSLPVVILADGKVSIGDPNPEGQARLYVKDTVTPGFGYIFRVDDEEGDTSSFIISKDGSVSVGLDYAPEAKFAIKSTLSAPRPSFIVWDSENDYTPFVIDYDGRVGIGVTGTPTEKLEVVGNVKATNFLSSSDERLKKDIKKIENALEKIDQLEGISFKWKETGKESIGLIAQNVEGVLPELVSEDNEGLKSIQYGNIVAVLIEAVKEQQKQIDELKKRC